MRLIIDTNIWIHYLIRSSHKEIDTLLSDPKTELLLSKEFLEEFLQVTARPKFIRNFTPEDVSELLMSLESRFPVIDVISVVNACRDPRDNFLLALAKDGKADYLITGDDDLLTMKNFEGTTIISLAALEKIIS